MGRPLHGHQGPEQGLLRIHGNLVAGREQFGEIQLRQHLTLSGRQMQQLQRLADLTAADLETCLTLDRRVFGASPEEVRLALEADDIEARPIWKPMHLQPLYGSCRVRERGIAAGLFERGLCLPSGTALTKADLERIASIVRHCHESASDG